MSAIPPIPSAPLRTTIGELLEEARSQLERVTPHQAHEALQAGAFLVDTRCAELRDRDGTIPGSVHVPLSVLFWRLDPASESRDERLAQTDARIILLCDHGYSSSMAAATLRRLGFAAATDVTGGFQAWRGDGLPVARAGAALPLADARPMTGQPTLADPCA